MLCICWIKCRILVAHHQEQEKLIFPMLDACGRVPVGIVAFVVVRNAGRLVDFSKQLIPSGFPCLLVPASVS